MKKQVLALDGSDLRKIELREEVFNIDVSEGSIYHAIRNELANQRMGTASTKTRGEVKGSNRKPWRLRGPPVTAKLSVWPRWKSVYKRETPTRRLESRASELTETALLTGRLQLLPTAWVDFGFERSYFVNLLDRDSEPAAGYAEDFDSWVTGLLMAVKSDYQGYALTMTSGFQYESQAFKDHTEKESSIYVRLFAASE